MSKQSLLLVDGDPRSLRVLEVSLRKAGFSVVTAESARAAQEKIVVAAPDLIISEIKLDDGDGFDLCRRVRATPEWHDIPFMFLTGEVGIENKIRGLELGVDEYLTKPIYIKEIVTRINMLLQKRQRARIEERKDQRTRFVGRIADMPVVDVIQTIEVSRKSGVIHFVGERNRQAAIYFRDGKVIDAEAGSLTAEDAVYRLLTWSEGDFEVVFRTVRRREVIEIGSQALLMEGMRRLDEWTRLLEHLPALTTHVDLKLDRLARKLGEIPDETNRLLRLIDGKRSLMAVIDACDLGDLEALQAIAQLHAQGLLIEVQAPASEDEERPRLSLDSVVARARGEESGPMAAPSTPAASSGSGPIELPGAPPGFRPSGLRKIDEAVAAAQAIDPDLAMWPEPGSVARTITGRARTISQITSFERTPEAPTLPRASGAFEIVAPPRSGTEPGIGSQAPPPAPVAERPRSAAQMAVVSAPIDLPRRSRSITGQVMVVAAARNSKTPPYGAPVTATAGEPIPPVVVGQADERRRAPTANERAMSAEALRPRDADERVDLRATPAETDRGVRATGSTSTVPPADVQPVAPTDDELAVTPARRDAVLSVVAGKPVSSRTPSRPVALPPGSGTSVALARKRRSSPPAPSRTSTPTGDGRPAAIARITTEQRAVRVSEVIETQRRETRRMITSLGAATAEVSGEVEAQHDPRAEGSETQRQMVTILPRRITREMPTLEVSTEPAAAARATPPAAPAAKPRAPSAADGSAPATSAESASAADSPSLAPRPVLVRRRVTEPGDAPSGKSASARRITREVPAQAAPDYVSDEAVGSASASGSIEVPAARAEAVVSADERSREAAPAAGVERDSTPADGAARDDAAAMATGASSRPDASVGLPARGDDDDRERDDDGGARAAGARGAAAVTPSWSPATRRPIQRAPAVLIGLAAVLALLAAASWLRGRGERRQGSPAPAAAAAPVRSQGASAPGASAPCPEVQATTGCGSAGAAGSASSAGAAASAPAPLPAPTSPTPGPPASATSPSPSPPAPPASATSSSAGAVSASAAPTAAAAVGADKADPGKESKALLGKARRALDEGNHTAALLYVDEALAIKKSARAHLIRASALVGLVRLEDALAAVDRAIAMSDNYAEGWLVRGRVLEALGRSGEAKAALTRFLELSPAGAAADEVRRRLAP